MQLNTSIVSEILKNCKAKKKSKRERIVLETIIFISMVFEKKHQKFIYRYDFS